MSEPLVSIVITVKNGASTLEQTIQSVLRQTYRNLELIVIDDGSIDNTWRLLEKLAKKDARLKFESSTIRGRGHALNQAINLAKGDWIAIVDADDLFHPEKLRRQLAFLLNNPTISVLGTNSLILYDLASPDWKNPHDEVELVYLNEKLLIRNTLIHSSVVINKADLVSIGAYNVHRTSQFDYELWLRFLEANKKMAILPLELTAKRIHSQQSFENKKRIRYLWNSSVLQMQFMLKLKKFLWVPIPIFTFCYGMLPFKVRKWIKK